MITKLQERKQISMPSRLVKSHRFRVGEQFEWRDESTHDRAILILIQQNKPTQQYDPLGAGTRSLGKAGKQPISAEQLIREMREGEED